MCSAQAIAHPPTDGPTLLQSLLAFSSYPTIVLICMTQAEFVRDILLAPRFDNIAPSDQLLRPTLHALSLAPHISMVFAPTLSHLRAWLTVADRSSFAPPAPSHLFGTPRINPGHANGIDSEKVRSQKGRLVVWNLVRSSCNTSEWSVQGLSETISALIDCGHRLDCDMDLVEAVEPQIEPDTVEHNSEIGVEEDEVMHDGMDGEEEEDRHIFGDESGAPGALTASNDIYHRRLPMLNGSSRRSGLNESAAWSGRTVEVGVVLKRWFSFSAIGY